ncbi:hypothetical protein ABVL22_004282 [Salmonella enterica]
MSVIEIGNVNINNHHELTVIAGIAGYAASVELINEITYKINLGDAEHMANANISMADINNMISHFVQAGFTVRKI